MATKKPASTSKKSVKKPAPVAKKTTTIVTTVKSAPAVAASRKFSFSRSPLLGASVAEFIGTFLLVAVVLATQNQPLYVLFGAVAVVVAVGAMSGAHLNPALTVGALATKRVNLVRAVCYVVAQVLGGLMALVAMNAFVQAAPAVSAEAAAFGQAAPELFKAAAIAEGKEWVVLAAELLGSVVLAFAVAVGLRKGAGSLEHAFAYGGGLFLALIAAATAAQYVGLNTAVFNPALAASLQALKFELWPIMVYVLTPIVGAVLGFALNDLVDAESKRVV